MRKGMFYSLQQGIQVYSERGWTGGLAYKKLVVRTCGTDAKTKVCVWWGGGLKDTQIPLPFSPPSP